jgi:hypothetical protein
MRRRSLDFSGLPGMLTFPLFYAFFLIMLILGLNHLGYLPVFYSWLFDLSLAQEYRGSQMVSPLFSSITHKLTQNSGITRGRLYLF